LVNFIMVIRYQEIWLSTPVVDEKVCMDVLAAKVFSFCAGIVFADYENLATTIINELKRKKSQLDTFTVRKEQLLIYNFGGKKTRLRFMLENNLC
jgi:hypothetical protein